MGATELANDAMGFVSELSPFWLLLGALSFADLTIGFLIRLWKQQRGKIKW